MNKLNKKITKILLILIFLMTNLLFKISSVQAADGSIIYKGPISYGGSTVGQFEVDGKQAFCIEHHKNSPPTGTPFTREVYNDERIAKALYYGYGGYEQWSGFQSYAMGTVVTTLMLSKYYTGVASNQSVISGFENYLNSVSLPERILYLSTTNATAFKDGDIQRTDEITLVGDSAYYVSLKLQDEVTLHNLTRGTTGTENVLVNGGDRFYLSAPINGKVTGTWTSPNIESIKYKFQPLILRTERDDYQDVAERGDYIQDPTAYTNLTINWLSLGGFTIKKVDNSGSVIKGAEFKVWNDSGYEKTITTGDDGTFAIDELTPGEYKVQEIKAPNGYLLDNTIYNINVEAGKTSTENIKSIPNDEPKGEIELKKINENGDGVEGATFDVIVTEDIYNKAKTQKLYSTGDKVRSVKSGENGFVKVTDLPLGSYIVKEVNVPRGYLLNTSEKRLTFTFKDSNTPTISDSATFLNKEPTGKLTLLKRDKKTGDNLSADGKYLHGDASLDGTTYTLYAKTDIYNVARTIKYFNKDEAVASFRFNEKGIPTNITILAKTNKSHLAVSGNSLVGIPLGSYYAKETKTTDGYLLDENVYNYDFNYKDMYTEVIDKSDTYYNGSTSEPFEVIKISTDTNDTAVLLKDVQFSVVLERYVKFYGSVEEAMKHTDEFADDEWDLITTQENGYAKTKGLVWGKYHIKETYNPYEWALNVKDFEFISVNHSKVPVQHWKIENDTPFKAYIRLIKKDKDSRKVVTLSNATFKLWKLNEDTGKFEEAKCKVGNQWITEWTTDKNGYAYTEDEMYYGTYKVTEIKLPDGFLDIDYDTTFEVTPSNAKTWYDKDYDAWIDVEIINEQPKGELNIEKKIEEVDETNKNIYYDLKEEDIDLSKIEYTLTAKEDIIDYSDGSHFYNKGDIIGKYNPSKDGTLKIANLPMGEYYLQETKTIDGLVLDNNKYEVVFTKEDNTTKTYYIDKNFTNKYTEIKINKLDTNKNFLKGAKLRLYAIDETDNEDTKTSSMRLIYEWTSDEGTQVIKGIPLGTKLLLEEVESPEGYVLSKPVEFDFENAEDENSITMINKIVEISKTDITTGEELEGAELEVIDEDGNVIDKWTSTKEPHKVKGLEEGKKYTLKETMAPYGYEIAEEVEFIVNSDKEIQKVEMKDKPILKNVRIVKIDIDNKETIKDDFTFGIYEDENCTKLIKEAKSNKEDGTILFDDLRYGTYYIKEIEAPVGYELSDKVVKIEINDKGIFVDDSIVEENDNTIEFNFENKKIEVPKTGDNSHIRLALGIIILATLGIAYIFIHKHNKDKENNNK